MEEETLLDFGEAIKAIKLGERVARKGWISRGMWIFKDILIFYHDNEEDAQTTEPSILMFTAQKNYIPWLASQTDMLAEDWLILEKVHGVIQ